MELLDRADLIDALRELIDQLKSRGEHAGIRIVGGAALALRYFERASTVDIDASIHPAGPVLEIAEGIAARRGWQTNWLNTNATMFIPPMRDAWEQIYDDAGISISVGAPEMLLAMKLNASRPGRDEGDIARLLRICSISDVTAAEDLFESFYPGEVLQVKAYRILTVVFSTGLPDAVDPPATPTF
ncbi:hypothetical protein BH11ACT3_BH11ACT3_18890 [soil metagenome]